MLQGFRNIGQTREEPHRDAEGAVQQSVGEMLETRRAEYGLDLRDVSNALRIRLPYLIAIEEGRLDELPGATYAIGFVRAYADHLGLDGPAVVERYKDETAALANAARLVFPAPLPEGKVPSGTILLIALLALAAVYGGWVMLSSSDRRLAELVPALPDRFLALIGADDAASPNKTPTPDAATPAAAMAPATETPARVPAATQPETQIVPKPLPPAEVDRAPPPERDAAASNAAPPSGVAPDPEGTVEAAANRQIADVVAAAPTPPEAPATAAAEPSPPEPPASERPSVESAAPQTNIAAAPPITDLVPPAPPAQNAREPRRYGAENADARVVIQATDDSWVQIRDKEGKLLLTRVLRVGDSYWVPNQSGVVMRTGNAGRLDIRVDGEPVPGLGPKGAIRHEVALDAERLKAGTAISR